MPKPHSNLGAAWKTCQVVAPEIPICWVVPD
jgi:hypothetical protein